MNLTFRKLAAICCALFVLACKKGVKKETSSCSSTIYGFHTPNGFFFDTAYLKTFGIVTTTGATSTIGAFHSSVYTNTGAFNVSDNCYYTFRIDALSGSLPPPESLYKVSLSGAVTALSCPSTDRYSAITYNKYDNKLYCQVWGTGNVLSEVTPATSSFTATTVATPAHPFLYPAAGESLSMGVDDSAGAIYFLTGDTATFYVEKYVPGGSGTTVIASGTDARGVLGLRFNKNDHMLYAVKRVYAAPALNSFIKIDPATGSISTVLPLSSDINPEFFSACIDPCSNKYLFTTIKRASATSIWFTGQINQINLTSPAVTTDTMSNIIQGLDVNFTD